MHYDNAPTVNVQPAWREAPNYDETAFMKSPVPKVPKRTRRKPTPKGRTNPIFTADSDDSHEEETDSEDSHEEENESELDKYDSRKDKYEVYMHIYIRTDHLTDIYVPHIMNDHDYGFLVARRNGAQH